MSRYPLRNVVSSATLSLCCLSTDYDESNCASRYLLPRDRASFRDILALNASLHGPEPENWSSTEYQESVKVRDFTDRLSKTLVILSLGTAPSKMTTLCQHAPPNYAVQGMSGFHNP